MASTSTSLPAHGAVQVLVASLADDSPLVRHSTLSALHHIAPMDPMLVLGCCSVVSRGGRRRFGNMAGVFQVMAWAVGAIETKDVDPAFMEKLIKIATAEIITSKELNAKWQRAAVCLLVSIGSHVPDLMMGEVFLHFSGPSAALPAMVQILADFALANALQFTPRLKEVFMRVLPILGNVRDIHKPIFANAFRCWCEAVCQYRVDLHSDPLHDTDVMSFLNSVFELLLRSWASSRDLKVRVSSVEALGQMVGLITRPRLKAALHRLIPTILDLCRKDQEAALVATCSLCCLLNAALLSESGPPLLDFEELLNILHSLLPMACINIRSGDHSDFSSGLKTYNEVQHCFLVIGSVYHEDLLLFLLNKCQQKEETSIVGALNVVKHLLPRLSEAWHGKMSLIADAVKLLLDEQNMGIRLALSGLLVVMASHCYLTGPSGELFVEFLVRHCAISDEEINHFEQSKEATHRSGSFQPFQFKKSEVKSGSIRPEDLRVICEKGLLLLAVTVPEMEHILWPFILKLIIPKEYTGAVATVCKCISELSRHKFFHVDTMFHELITHNEIPNSVDLFARLVVLLHDPLARENLSSHILTVLCQLGPLFPKNVSLFWQDEVPKMKAYVSDPEDLKQDSSYLETWDDMIIDFLAESLDVVRDSDWVVSLGNAFARQYDLYDAIDGHSALLHRCIGMLLQKVDDRVYVREKIDWMYNHANISIPANRLGLAKGIGLVSASHLDTVLDKLKNILENVGRSKFQRFLSFFYGTSQSENADDIHAALALMYGYAARYAPSTVIEARIDALVGTNMLSHLLHVQHHMAKEAVITAIDLLGLAVMNAAESGISFPLKRRDQMLKFVLTLMGRNETDGQIGSSLELLHTQSVALSACTTLVSLEPKLPMETRNRVMKATLGFFALPNNPADIVDPLIGNLITLLSAILLTSGEDGRSRSEQLLHILRQVDQYVSSPVEHQRKRGCTAVYELLLKFRALCSGGHCSLEYFSSGAHSRQVERTLQRNFSSLPSAFVLPSRDSLSIGERVINYIPRCADTSSEVRKVAVQIVGLFFSISLSLPRQVGSKSATDVDLEVSYNALYSLEDVISILRRDASIDQSEVFNRVISSVCTLLTKNELVVCLHACSTAICDKIKQSAEGAIQAVVEFISKRGNELNESEVSRTTQSLLLATMSVNDKSSRQEVLNAISSLAENTHSNVVFTDVLAAAGRDIVTKDVSRLRGGWAMQDAFHTFSQHGVLSRLFLEHVVNVLNETPVQEAAEKCETSTQSSSLSTEEEILQAAIVALTEFFKGGGKTGRRSVENSYATVFSALILQLGSSHGLAHSGHHEPLRILFTAFQSFCECVGDLEMGKILARHGEQNDGEKWINLIGELACCISIKRPKEVSHICVILNKALDQSQRFQREAAAAALSEFVRYSDGDEAVLESMVETMCLHVSDESPAVRSLCLKGLVQIPGSHMLQYVPKFIGVIVALLEDPNESVQLTAVQCLMVVLEASPKDSVEHFLLNIGLRLRTLQMSLDVKMRSNAFAAYGLLSSYSDGPEFEAFIEQVHATLPRLVFHVYDDDVIVRQACRKALRRLAPLIKVESFSATFNTQCFTSDRRSDYEDFLRDLTRQLSFNFPSRADTYLASAIQAFDAPWPVIQANAIYFSCCLLSLLDDLRSLAPSFTQVFGTLVGKMNKSSDAVVRSTCSYALGILLRASNPNNWEAAPPEKLETMRKSES